MSCVKEQIVSTIRKRLAAGDDLDSVAWDAVKTHLNLERAGVNTDVQGVLKFMTEIMDNFTQNAKGGVRSYQRTVELMRENLLLHGNGSSFADSLVKTAGDVKNLEATLLGARVYRNQIAEELDNLVKMARGGDTAAEAKIPELVAEALKVHAATDQIQTSAARGVSQGNIVAGAKVDWGNVAKAAEQATSGGGFNARRFLAELDMAGGSAESQLGLIKQFAAPAQGLFSKLLSIHNEIWINGILGSITTQSANFLANTANMFLQPLTKIVGGALSFNPGVIKRGMRDVVGLNHALFDVFDLAKRASGTGADSTLTAVGKSLWNESPMLDKMFKAGEGAGPMHAITAENLGVQNVPLIGALVDATGQVVRWPTRALTSADELFKQLNYRAAVRSQALEAAEKQGLLDAGRHTELTSFMDDFMGRAFDESGMATNKSALLAAQQATFTNDLVGKLSKDLSNLIGKHPGLRPVIPFVRTPINIMREFWQYTPGLNLLQGEFRGNLLSKDALTAATARGKLAIGAAGTYMMYQAANSGQITGSGPANTKQREALMATGWRPYSFVIQNDDGSKSYVDYRRLDPAATLIGLVADVAEVSHHMDDPEYHGLFNAIVMSMSQNITSRTYLRGLSELTTVLGSKDPNAVQRVIDNRLGSYVPGYVASMNDDPNMREVRTWVDAIRRRVPGISKDLPPRRDMFGDVMTVPVGYALDGEPENGVPRISPFGYSKRVGDPVKEELASVANNTPGGDHGFDKPQKTIQGLDLTKFVSGDGQDAYDRYQELHGQVMIKGKTMPDALSKMIDSKYYQSLPDPSDPTETNRDARMRALQSVVAQYREQAREKLFKEFPEINAYIQGVNKAHRLQQAPSIARILNY
jgi:hypothetical protein